jgi:hypothetical protein
VLEIEVLEPGQAPRFRITRAGNPAKLLVLMVHEVGSEDPIWVLGPDDMVMTQEVGFSLTDAHPATPEELLAFKESADSRLGQFAAEVSEVAYGFSPPGLNQALPRGVPAPALESGRRYLVFAAGSSEMGSAEFTA